MELGEQNVKSSGCKELWELGARALLNGAHIYGLTPVDHRTCNSV